MVNCVNCDAVIDVEKEDLDEGEELTCEECGATMMVSSLDPLELELADDEDEDEDDQDLDFSGDEEDDEDEDDEEDEEDEEEEDWK